MTNIISDAQKRRQFISAQVQNKSLVSPTVLTFKNCASYIQDGRTATFKMFHFIYIFLTNINTEYFKHSAHSLFFSSKCRLFHNVTFFGSCIIHTLHTECAEI
jgi:hypothetical protein